MRKIIDKISEWLVSFGTDKWVHLVASIIVAYLVTKMAQVLMLLTGSDWSRAEIALIGVFGGVVAAFAKELYDHHTTQVFEDADLRADFIGLLLFYIIYAL